MIYLVVLVDNQIKVVSAENFDISIYSEDENEIKIDFYKNGPPDKSKEKPECLEN